MLRKLARAALALALAGCAGAPAEPTPDAEALLDAGRTEQALAWLERELARRPDDPELSIRIGQIELERGRTADAYHAFRRAAALAPDEIRAVSGLALAADALGFDEEAAAAYARWAELEEDRGDGPSGSAGDPESDPW